MTHPDRLIRNSILSSLRTGHPPEVMVLQATPNHTLPAAQALEREARLLDAGDTVVVAVSGGPDSMALLEYLADLRRTVSLRLIVAHVLHGFRSADARREASFVRRQAQRLGLSCVVEEVDAPAYAKRRKLSPQAAARTLRYDVLRKVQRARNAQKLAVGHTADDQVETVLLNFLRGAGPRGLRAMQPSGPHGLIRPLLTERRSSILAYLRQRGVSFLVDPTNAKDDYQRNRIRRHLLPLLERDYQPNVREHLIELARVSRADNAYLQQRIAELAPQIVEATGAGILEMNVAQLQQLPDAMLDRLIMWCCERLTRGSATCSAAHVRAVRHLIRSSGQQERAGGARGRSARRASSRSAGRRCDLAEGITVWRAYGRLRWQRRNPADASRNAIEQMLPVPGSIQLANGSLRSEVFDLDDRSWPKFTTGEAWIDMACVRGPLRVRGRRPGDRLQPLGMQGSKSLKALFIDDKVPLYERSDIPLVVDDEAVIWVVGGRLHHAYRLTDATQRAVHLRYCVAAERLEP